jgi:hypothetical protein
MAVTSGCGSWFGFGVGFRFAGAIQVFQEFGEGRRSAVLPAAELVDHDVVQGTLLGPGLVAAGDREAVGLVLQLAPVLVVVGDREVVQVVPRLAQVLL